MTIPLMKTVRPVLALDNTILAVSPDPLGRGEVVWLDGSHSYEQTETVVIEEFVSVEINQRDAGCNDRYFYRFRRVLDSLNQPVR